MSATHASHPQAPPSRPYAVPPPSSSLIMALTVLCMARICSRMAARPSVLIAAWVGMSRHG